MIGTEVLKALIVAVATAIVTAIVLYIRSRRGNRLVVVRISETPQIRISESAGKNLDIRYKGQVVDDLVLNRLYVANHGQNVIEPLEIELTVSARQGTIDFWEFEYSDPLSKTKLERKDNSLRIERDFINPKRAYKEESIEINIFSNTQLKFSVVGGGRSWYAQFEDRSIPNEKILKKLRLLFFSVLVLAIFDQVTSTLVLFIPENSPYLRYLLINRGASAAFFLIAACGILIYYFRIVAHGSDDALDRLRGRSRPDGSRE